MIGLGLSIREIAPSNRKLADVRKQFSRIVCVVRIRINHEAQGHVSAITL